MNYAQLKQYHDLLASIKEQIVQSQHKAFYSANATMLQMYWCIGRLISERQKQEGWGKSVIPRLSTDLKNDFPEQKGFSERNIGYMIAFYREYPILQQTVAKLTVESDHILNDTDSFGILQQGVAKSQNVETSLIFAIPWGHNVILMEKVKDMNARFWYMRQIVEFGWSRDLLVLQIKSDAYARNGNRLNNFDDKLNGNYAAQVKRNLKDPYLFDFLTIGPRFNEYELETKLTEHIQKFLLELGRGFAFVGRQYPLSVDNQDFAIDMLFYHLKLRSFVVIDLKIGKFLPEYAGKMNFYCNLVDAQLKHETDNPTIGLILCQNENRIIAEYTLKDMQKPIGIAEYEIPNLIPTELKSSLPSIEEIETELSK